MTPQRRYAANYYAGNYKRQGFSKTGEFDDLQDAVDFVEQGIGDLQGDGRVSEGSEIVWEYVSPDEEDYWEAA